MLTYGGGRGKLHQQQAQSSEEELGFGDDGGAAASGNAVTRDSQQQPPCPWQRIKWTDGMVRLLVWVVHGVGEDAAAADCGEHQLKGKKAADAAARMQQKKGKWKSVSKGMMEKGFYVSPQQCEDKFNDLNKRYKRLNELLGKGTACKVVENPTLLDSLADRLPDKAIDEARKLLVSKHLFFREMCAYHSTFPAPSDSGEVRKDHSTSFTKGQKGNDGIEEECRHQKSHFDITHQDEEEEENYNSEGNEECDDSSGMFTGCGRERWGNRKVEMWPAESSPLSLSLSSPSGYSSTPAQQLKREMTGLPDEQRRRQWLRMKAAELEERRVEYQNRALQLERQRFKWLRFSCDKEREMERTRLMNERRRLENHRMLLLLQQKEFDLLGPASNADANADNNFSVNQKI